MCFESAQAESPVEATQDSLASELEFAGPILKENEAYAPQYTALQSNDLDQFMNSFLPEYGNNIMPALTAASTTANSELRTANLADAARLTPQYVAEERAANPEAAGLLDTLTSNTQRDLSYGTALTPQEQVQFNQSTRQGQAARGMGQGPADVFNETLADTGYGQALYQQREGAAQGLVPTLQSFYGNPTSAISGMNSGAGMTANSLFGAAASSTAPAQSQEFNPSGMASQLEGISAQMGLANAGAENSGISMGIGAVGSL